MTDQARLARVLAPVLALALLVALLFLDATAGSTPRHDASWTRLAAGLELRWITARSPSPVGDSRIVVIRADPAQWQLVLVGRSNTGDTANHTARKWADAHDLQVAINAGMFAADYKTHVGYMESRGHVASSVVNKYQSVAAFDPHDPDRTAPFRIFDLDDADSSLESIRMDYASLVQNLRLVKRPGENRWSRQERSWSEAALGEDEEGRILLIFCRSPFSMHDFNDELLSAGIGLVALQHLEGGPEAQLYVNAGHVELELSGSHETSFTEDDGNSAQWPIPNVLGIKRRSD